MHGRNTKNGNILEELWLNIDNVEKAYEEINRTNIKSINAILMKKLENIKFQKKWLEEYRKDMLNYILTKNKPNNLFPSEFSDDILKVLEIIDKEEQYLKRVLSIKCFGDSKYFEKNIEHFIIRIIKKYLLVDEFVEETRNDEILLEVRNFKISRNI